MVFIRTVKETELADLLAVITSSFMTVAEEFNLTERNAGLHPAFLGMDSLETLFKSARFFGLYENDILCACCSIRNADQKGTWEIEKLAVIPAKRRNGYGKALLDFACRAIQTSGGVYAAVSILFENEKLKTWYEQEQFIVTEIKKFPNLPFTVGFMRKKL